MTRFIVRQWYGLFLLLLGLNACTNVAVKEPGTDKTAAYHYRSGKLNAIADWGFVGKISLDDGDRGGSGKLQWDVKPGQSELDFHGALGRGAWHLQIGEEGALLKMADGSEERASSVSDLIQDSVGWPVPFEALQWWVRGLAAPGAIENEQLGPDGLLLGLRQFGWSVDFQRYDSVGGIGLPVRLNATRDQYRVKLAVRHWRMDETHDISD